MDTKVLAVRHFKAGYEVRTEEVDMGTGTKSMPVVMRSAYNLKGEYIGNSRDAHRLVVKRGIAPEKAAPEDNVCSIGYCKSQRKWYGWSHRAIFGFGIGSVVKEGDCTADGLPVGFKAKSLDDAKKMAMAFAESVS